MEHLPLYVYVVFTAATLLSVLFFYAAKPSRTFLWIITSWILVQSFLAYSGFFKVTDTIPPRLVLLIMPPLIATLLLFRTKKGKAYVDSMNIKVLSLLHVVRIPVEMVLFWLFVHKAIPGLLTFEGRNFDILSGLTAPVVYYLGFVKQKLGNRFLLAWNFACLVLLAVVVFHGVLSVPTPLQQFAFEQPNIAMIYLPFVWLPGVVVPLVYVAHFVTIRQLLQRVPQNCPQPELQKANMVMD